MSGAADWVRNAVARLSSEIGAQDARREARMIVQQASGWSAARVAVAGDEPLSSEAVARADRMLARRCAREPLAQIFGSWPFYGRTFEVSSAVLTPRPDTETLVDLALEEPFGRLIDLGTGSGVLAISLLAERSGALGVASDLSLAALDVARRNGERHGVAGRLRLIQSDWWDANQPEAPVDLIVSNPPYVTEAEYAQLAPEITEHEPRMALTPGGDGLSPYRALVAGDMSRLLVPGGRILVEIGPEQGQAVAELFEAARLGDIRVHRDIDGRDRVVAGRMPATALGAAD